MRRKDRERDRSFAWEVLKKAPYATLSLTDGQGRPYAVPVNQAVDEEYHVVYFHCAGAGEKWELLKDGAEVCLSAVSHATASPSATRATVRCWTTIPSRAHRSPRRDTLARGSAARLVSWRHTCPQPPQR